MGKKRRVRLAAALLLWIWPVCGLNANPRAYAPVVLPETHAGIRVEILPEIELLSGVLYHTSWRGYSGLEGKGNAYFRELNEFFKPYIKHGAFRIADRLTKKGFSYDAPPHFIACLGPLPDLKPVHGYDDYVVRRAGGRVKLEEFRQALSDLAGKSNFRAFWESHQEAYKRYLHETTGNFRAGMLVEWLSKFFASMGSI